MSRDVREPAATRAPLDAILTPAEVAAWLKIKPRQVQRLGIPFFDLGLKTKRYLAKDVLGWLESRRGLQSVVT